MLTRVCNSVTDLYNNRVVGTYVNNILWCIYKKLKYKNNTIVDNQRLPVPVRKKAKKSYSAKVTKADSKAGASISEKIEDIFSSNFIELERINHNHWTRG